jgi:hypothetical protein
MTLLLQLLIAKTKIRKDNLFSKLNIQLIEIYCDDFICTNDNIRYPSFDEKLDEKKLTSFAKAANDASHIINYVLL